MMVPCTPLRREVITYFAPCDPRQGMGGGARVEQMLTAFERLGLHITVVSYDGSGDLGLTHGIVSRRTKIVQLGLPARVPKILKSVAIPILVLIGLAHTGKNPWVITHSPGLASGLIGLLVSQFRRGHLIVDLTDARDRDTPQAVYELVLRSASVVFAVSHRLERLAQSFGARTVVYLPTFLDMSRYFRDNRERETTRTSLGLAQNNTVIGYFGSFARIEGLPTLLEAFSIVSKAEPDAKLLIVGSRNVEGADDIERIIRDRHIGGSVLLLPPQAYVEIPKMLRAADLLVAPKIQAPENEVADPIKIYEYLASGTPCILSSIAEVAAMAGKAEAAFIVEPGDTKALSQMILHVLANPELAHAYAARGRRLIENSYNIERASNLIRRTLADHVGPKPIVEGDRVVA